MGFAEQIADLTKSVNGLVTTVKGQTTKWNNAVNAQINRLESWKAGFMNGDATKLNSLPKPVPNFYNAKFGDFENWATGGATVEEIGTIVSGVAWDDRTPFDKEWLTGMGLEGIQYFFPNSFKVYRLTVDKDRESYCFPYFQVPTNIDNYITIGAFVKHIDGAVPHSGWCHGLKEQGGIQLCGGASKTSSSHYTYCHPIKEKGTSDTVIEVALAGVVDRYVDLSNPRNWFNFQIGE